MTTHPYVIADVFTDTPLEGNPLAVFPDAGGIDEATMPRLARELNLSETVFAFAPRDGADARIRIFTPAAELPFAGHPVLGTAVVLAGDRELVRLETGLGVVPVRIERGPSGHPVGGSMEQPLPELGAFDASGALLDALGAGPAALPIETYVNGPTNVMVALADEDAVARLVPDLRAIVALGTINVSCFAGAGTRWKTRVFAPALNVPEDPATGSAAGPLALHLARHGRIAFGQEIEIRQGAELGRPSLLRARVDGADGAARRIEVGGAAVIVARGAFDL